MEGYPPFSQLDPSFRQFGCRFWWIHFAKIPKMGGIAHQIPKTDIPRFGNPNKVNLAVGTKGDIADDDEEGGGGWRTKCLQVII